MAIGLAVAAWACTGEVVPEAPAPPTAIEPADDPRSPDDQSARETAPTEKARRLARGAAATPRARGDIEALQSLPYAGGSRTADPDRVGVQVHVRERAWPGLNFFVSRKGRAAVIIDMDGQPVHRWRHPTPQAWEAAVPLTDGGLVLVAREKELVRLAADNSVAWRIEGRFHHQPSVSGDFVHALRRQAVSHPDLRTEGPLFDDILVTVHLDGRLLEERSMLDLATTSGLDYLLPAMDSLDEFEGPVDLLHVNHAEFLDGSLSHRSPLFAAGNLLVSMRNVNSLLPYGEHGRPEVAQRTEDSSGRVQQPRLRKEQVAETGWIEELLRSQASALDEPDQALRDVLILVRMHDLGEPEGETPKPQKGGQRDDRE